MNKALIGPLGKDTVKLVLDRALPQDQWHLVTASGSLYRLFGQSSQINIIYSFSVIPEGALEHSIFKKYPPNFVALIKFLRIRARHQKFIAAEFPFFDYEDVWPLVAIMGNEVALRELIGEDPKRKDANGKCALDYLAFSDHKTALVNWINDFYPEFGLEEAPSLHYYAALGGSEEIVFLLKDEYGFDINDSGGKRGWYGKHPVTILHGALWGKHTALMRRLIDAKVDLHKTHPIRDGLAVSAAEMGLWDWCEEFLAQETTAEKAGFNDNRCIYLEAAACFNKQEKMEELRIKRADLDTGEPYEEPTTSLKAYGQSIGHGAIRCGQIEFLDFAVAQGWVDINGVFCSEHKRVDHEDKHPALFVAAIHGQLKMFDHLVEKYGLDPQALFKDDTVLHWMIAMTTWNNFEYIAQKYFRDYNFFSPQDIVPPLNDAIQSGVLYNAQQYIKKYCGDDNFLEYAKDIIALAEECEQTIITKWLKFKLASLKPSEEHSNNIEEADSNLNRFGN